MKSEMENRIGNIFEIIFPKCVFIMKNSNWCNSFLDRNEWVYPGALLKVIS